MQNKIKQRQKELINNDTFLEKGQKYFENDLTYITSYEVSAIGDIVATGKTEGSHLYAQKITYDKRENEITTLCSCPVRRAYGSCKHLASFLFELEKKKHFLKQVIEDQQLLERHGSRHDVVLQILEKKSGKYQLSFLLKNPETEELYPIVNIIDFIYKYREIIEDDTFFFVGTKEKMLLQEEFSISEEHEQFLEWVLSTYEPSIGGKQHGHLTLDAEMSGLPNLLDILSYAKQEQLPVYLEDEQGEVRPIEIEEVIPEGHFCLEKEAENFRLSFVINESLTDEQIVIGDKIVFNDKETMNQMLAARKRFTGTLSMNKDGDILKKLSTLNRLAGYPLQYEADIFTDMIIDQKPTFECKLTRLDGNILDIKVIAHYGPVSIDLKKNEASHTDRIIIRKPTLEKKVLGIVTQKLPLGAMNRYIAEEPTIQIRLIEDIFDYLDEGVPLILENENPKITVLIDESLEKLRIKSVNMKMKITPMTNNYINLQLEDEDQLSFTDLKTILFEYQLKKRYIELSNGAFLDVMNQKNRKQIENLLKYEDELMQYSEENHARIPNFKVFDFINKDGQNEMITCDEKIDDMILELAELKATPINIAPSLKAVLRPYQLIGVYWLQLLEKHGFGGILADEMGLGKTIQMITFLSAKEHKKERTLIVTPKTLMYNWINEFKKFAPQFNITIIEGTISERQKKIEAIKDGDIVITSYPLIAKDYMHYTETFDQIVVDEAQTIKNPTTKMARTIKMIPSKQRFALTGTPMENNLMEVWSIFDFLMPGFLESQKKFIQKVFNPVYRQQDEAVLGEFKEKISPFILRREKAEVLSELPDKIETELYCEMGVEQRDLYNYYLALAQEEVREELKQEAYETTGRIKILAIITRLRQICTHPKMFVDNYKGESAKLEMLMELLEELISDGHRVLLFSQFTSMLEIIGESLEENNINYQYLHGQVPSKERINMVDEFNDEDADEDVFLLSLKAGGTGLNLTSADIVIHFDPWWNPSVENQATDRAHRFGQKNVVQVFQFITKNTIEEKIAELKVSKQEMFNALFTSEQQAFNQLSIEDIEKILEL